MTDENPRCLCHGPAIDVLTQHGRSAAVLVDVAAYEALVEQVELLHDIRTAEDQIRKGEGLSHVKARAKILARTRR